MEMIPDAERRFRETYEAHLASVYAYCRRRTDIETAQDATAETFLVAWRRIDVMPDGDGTLPWLYAVARRVLGNQYRSKRRRARLREKAGATAVASGATPETIVMRRSEEHDVLEALARLCPDDQELLRLAVWEELPHRLIAEALSCSPHTVDQRIYRASKRLAREMRRAGHIPLVRTTPHQQTGTRQ